jgi:hypothetical protein
VTIPDVLAIVALILGTIDVARSKGAALTSWGVVALALALLWHLIPTS